LFFIHLCCYYILFLFLFYFWWLELHRWFNRL
jgi:hypothetical protein